MILMSQVLNGVLLPLILVFTLMLINRKDLMGEWVNSVFYNVIAWATVVTMTGLSLVWAVLSI